MAAPAAALEGVVVAAAGATVAVRVRVLGKFVNPRKFAPNSMKIRRFL
jgi:hypothetical protein